MIANDILTALVVDETLIFFVNEADVLFVQSVESGIVAMMKADVLRTNAVNIKEWLSPFLSRLPANVEHLVRAYLKQNTTPGVEFLASTNILQRADPEHLNTHALRT
jgi:hypothetical protein